MLMIGSMHLRLEICRRLKFSLESDCGTLKRSVCKFSAHGIWSSISGTLWELTELGGASF
jgi:hypothetical protein